MTRKKLFSLKMHINHQKQIMSLYAIDAEIEGRGGALRAPSPFDLIKCGLRPDLKGLKQTILYFKWSWDDEIVENKY